MPKPAHQLTAERIAAALGVEADHSTAVSIVLKRPLTIRFFGSGKNEVCCFPLDEAAILRVVEVVKGATDA